ncbi:MAG: Gfo/Idh/MocA family oxidoreductase [Granulosicoccus sp.]
MLKFGILSTARIGVEQVIPAIHLANKSVLTAIASRDISKAEKIANHFNAPLAFGSYEELLESSDIDAVYIPLPTSQHVEWTIKAIEAGKHVLCEKPIALNAAEIDQIIEARDKHAVVVSEAFMVTYHPQWLKVRELLAEGKIGKLRQVESSFSYYNIDPQNMRNKLNLGGGVIPDIAVYPTVTTRFATGYEPVSIEATVEYDPRFNTDRYASVRAEFPSFELTFYVSTQLANRQTMVFHGDKGFIELSAPFNSNLYEGDTVSVHNGKHSETSVYRYTGINQYQYEIEAFARAVTGEDQDIFTLEESRLNQQVIDAIYKSGNSGNREKV